MARELAIPIKYVYMGINLENSNLVLPTTRLLLEIKRLRGGRPDMAGPSRRRRAARPATRVRRVTGLLRASLRLANIMAEEWFRQLVIWYYQLRGNVVLMDRHFFLDYFAHDVTGPDRSWPSRVHGAMLRSVYPRPDVVIMLDAPAEVLFARKGEGTVELLEERRREYLLARDQVPAFYVVDATRPEDEVAQRVGKILRDHYAGTPPSAVEPE
ncbi:MAG TPA: hypothetical protein VFT85_04395 [Acidimicrobiia bacterium]|nr:hypothetical protein [Acidimicrobiia bacterium]